MLKLRDIGHFLLLLPLLAIILLHTDLGCMLIKMQMEKELSQMFETKVQIGKMDFNFPNGLELQDIRVVKDDHASLSIKELNIETSLTALVCGNTTTAMLDFTEIRARGLELSKLRIHLRFDEVSHHWKCFITGQEKNLHKIAAEGSFTVSPQQVSIEIQSAEIGETSRLALLQKPVHGQYAAGKLELSPIHFVFGPLTAELKFSCTSTHLDARLFCHISSLESLEALLANSSLTGKSTLNLQIEGPWNKPEMHGSASIREASFEGLYSGIHFQHINADCVIEGKKLEVRSFTASDPTHGSITAKGALDFDDDWHCPFRLNLHLNKAAVFNLNDTEFRGSGDLVLAGDRFCTGLSGELQVDEVDLYLKGGGRRASHQLAVTYINQPFEEQPPTSNTQTSFDWPIQLDLHLFNSGSILISDEQLTSKWKGDVKLTGTLDVPLLHGDCRLLHGDYLFNGKKFQLTQGTISFTGEPRKKTQLYVVGEQEVASIAVEVILKGPLDDLELVFRSTPPLSEKEILSRLLFGRGTGDITPFQGAELNESINKLKHHHRGAPDFIGRLKKSFGLDRIDISRGNGAESDEISLQIGKYLTPGVFIGITKGITADSNRIGIEADLKRNVKIQAEIGDDSEGQLHLKWKHDY